MSDESPKDQRPARPDTVALAPPDPRAVDTVERTPDAPPDALSALGLQATLAGLRVVRCADCPRAEVASLRVVPVQTGFRIDVRVVGEIPGHPPQGSLAFGRFRDFSFVWHDGDGDPRTQLLQLASSLRLAEGEDWCP